MKELRHQIATGLRWINKLLPLIAVILGFVIVFGLGEIVHRQHESNLESCARGNDSRLGNVKNLQGDVRTLKAQLALWEAVQALSTPASKAATPPVVERAFIDNMRALRHGITHKQQAVRASIRAQSSVAIRPGSPVDDCSKAYP